MKSKTSSDLEEKISLITFPFKPEFVLRKGSSVQIESLDICGPVDLDQGKEPTQPPKQNKHILVCPFSMQIANIIVP